MAESFKNDMESIGFFYQPKKVRAESTVSISSNSLLGQKLLGEVVQKALVDNGFTNVTVVKNTLGRPSQVKSDDATPSVLDAIMERNPSFFASHVRVEMNTYQMNEIAPDSEYPCAGAPLSHYAVSPDYTRDINAYDVMGGSEYFATMAIDVDAQAVADTLNKAFGKEVPVKT